MILFFALLCVFSAFFAVDFLNRKVRRENAKLRKEKAIIMMVTAAYTSSDPGIKKIL
jgi:hypothetical protein